MRRRHALIDTDLRDALAIDRALRRRGATEAVAVPGGLVVRHPGLPAVHYLNALLLDAGRRAQPAQVGALADRWLGDLGHRHVVLDDGAAGERLWARLMRDGWTLRRTVFMALAQPPPLSPDPRAREISEPELRALQLATLREQVSPARDDSELLTQLHAAQAVLRAGTPARRFGAGEDGSPASMCTLFLDPDVNGRRVAMLDEVATLAAHREQGLARAALGLALAAAADWGAQLTVVATDADDWPQLMYGRLGFRPLGRQVSLTLATGPAATAPAGPAATAPAATPAPAPMPGAPLDGV